MLGLAGPVAAACRSVFRRISSCSVAVALLAGLRLEAQDVLTYHNANSRTGQYLVETRLTPQTVNASTFIKLFSYTVDGYVYAQPLYKGNVTIAGGTHNVVYVATEEHAIERYEVVRAAR